jgi:hemoglobin/transferrin/lactoferrin receptor protein
MMVMAADEPESEVAMEMAPMVVVASKSPRPLTDVAGQVSVINAADIEGAMVEGLDDLFRYEPGLEVEQSGTRFGVESVNLRGIGGNRVAIEVDGVPVRKRFAVGSYSNAGRSLVETDRIKRLEILHGPASTLYGSDALGGVLAFTTWDPADLLSFGDTKRYYSVRGGYRGADESWVGSGVAAWGGERTGLLAAATLRHGHEPDHQGSADVPADLQNWDSSDYQMRLVHDTANGHLLRFTASAFERDTSSKIQSILGYARFRSTTELRGEDHDQSHGFGLDYEFSGAGWSAGILRLFSQRSLTEQLTLEERAAARVPVRLERYFEYTSDLDGLELNLFRDIQTARSAHRLGLGIEWTRTSSKEFRDGFQQNIADGSISTHVLGEQLPVRDFPISDTHEVGLFIQDEITFANGRWALIPALRWDGYRLEPQADAMYLEDNPATPPVSLRDDRFSPRLGALYHWADGWSLYGQYVQGFRAPPFEDVNIGLDIPLFNIRAIPNPDLKSETSQGWEFGLRQYHSGRQFSLALFSTDYDEFIETRARVGIDPASGVLLFQSRNIERARIQGWDLRLVQDLGRWLPSASDWSLQFAAYAATGENLETGQPLNSVSPPQAVVGLIWSAPGGRWTTQLTGTFTRRQDEIDASGGERIETPGYGVLDFVLTGRLSPRLELRAGVFNLGDKRYWRWSDVSRLAPQDPMAELMTRPGRNYSVSARWSW